MLARCHAEVQHRIGCPFLLHTFDEELLEQLLPSLEIGLDGGYKQGLVILSISPNEEGVSKFNVAYRIVILF